MVHQLDEVSCRTRRRRGCSRETPVYLARTRSTSTAVPVACSSASDSLPGGIFSFFHFFIFSVLCCGLARLTPFELRCPPYTLQVGPPDPSSKGVGAAAGGGARRPVDRPRGGKAGGRWRRERRRRRDRVSHPPRRDEAIEVRLARRTWMTGSERAPISNPMVAIRSPSTGALFR